MCVLLAAQSLLIDVTSLVKPGASSILKLFVLPETIQPGSGAWTSSLSIGDVSISVQ